MTSGIRAHFFGRPSCFPRTILPSSITVDHSIWCTMEKPDWTKWKTPPSVLACPNTSCLRVSKDWELNSWVPDSDVSFQFNETCPFMVDCVCRNCDRKYIVCTKCGGPRGGQFSNKELMIRHCRRSHSEWFDINEIVRNKRKPPPLGSTEGSARKQQRSAEQGTVESNAENLHDKQLRSAGFVLFYFQK